MYYAASLLRDTVSAGDSKYRGIHKVYSVWLCNDVLPGLCLADELKEQYVHTYSLWRNYENSTQVYKDKYADLMQVVMVELSKLKKNDGLAAEMLYKLFNETQDIVSVIERVAGVTLLDARKGVGAMVNYETLLEEANTKAEEANMKAVRNIVKSWFKLKQDYTAAKAYVLEEYPDIDMKLLDSIIFEVYGL